MRYFIMLDGEKVIEKYCGPFTGQESKSILERGYIEVNEKYAELMNSMYPLIYKNNELSIDHEKQKINIQIEQLSNELSYIYSQLQGTDYVACKIAEGAATKEEYQDILNQRIEWRNQINELQKEIDKLK